MPARDDELNAERLLVLKTHILQSMYDLKADLIAPVAQGARLAEKGEDNKFACFKGLKSTNINSRFLAWLDSVARQPPAVTIVKKTKEGEASAPSTPNREGRAGSASPKKAEGKKASPSKRRKMEETEDEEEELDEDRYGVSDWSARDDDDQGHTGKSPAKGGAKVKAERR